MVKIRITDIPKEGLEINEELCLDAINSRMNEAPDNDITFIEAPRFSVLIKPELGGAELSGTISTRYKQPCARCLEEISEFLKQELSLTLKAKTKKPGIERPTEATEWDDGIGIVYFDGEHIDLEDILQETLILSLDPFNSAHEGCKGVVHTGDEKEEKQTLGSLLEKAMKGG